MADRESLESFGGSQKANRSGLRGNATDLNFQEIHESLYLDWLTGRAIGCFDPQRANRRKIRRSSGLCWRRKPIERSGTGDNDLPDPLIVQFIQCHEISRHRTSSMLGAPSREVLSVV